jgi:hypothetical protein
MNDGAIFVTWSIMDEVHLFVRPVIEDWED